MHDLSFAEVHDCFTIAELIEYEAMGLAPEGQGARAIAEGIVAKDGKLPINPSGGLKAKGHPIGATGVSMHALASMQLTGTAGDMQVKDAAARRHLQHGRRRGRQLRQYSRTAALAVTASGNESVRPYGRIASSRSLSWAGHFGRTRWLLAMTSRTFFHAFQRPAVHSP